MALSGQGAAMSGSTAGEAADDMVIEPAPPATAPTGNSAAQSEALSALGNLGYGPGDAASAVAQALSEDPYVNTATLIRSALKLLAPKS